MATAITASSEYVALARTLPSRLLRFFADNPPAVVRAHKARSASSTITQTSSTSEATHSTAQLPSRFSRWKNPFLPHKNPKTGAWHPPLYGLRRQADLVKLARAHGVEELLPWSPKGSEAAATRQEKGLRIKGTGVGQNVKGHAWERSLQGRLEERRKAMMDMPRLVQEWKLRGHGRGIKKWPK